MCSAAGDCCKIASSVLMSMLPGWQWVCALLSFSLPSKAGKIVEQEGVGGEGEIRQGDETLARQEGRMGGGQEGCGMG